MSEREELVSIARGSMDAGLGGIASATYYAMTVPFIQLFAAILEMERQRDSGIGAQLFLSAAAMLWYLFISLAAVRWVGVGSDARTLRKWGVSAKVVKATIASSRASREAPFILFLSTLAMGFALALIDPNDLQLLAFALIPLVLYVGATTWAYRSMRE